MVEPNFEAIKEPRGFLRVLQFFLAIFAFATTTSFSSFLSFEVNCPLSKVSRELKFSYPFKIHNAKIEIPFCSNSSEKKNMDIYGDFSGSSQFYVFVGVITMIYCVGILVLYILFSENYYDDERIRKYDFLVSAGLVVLWFICCVAWSDGVAKLKEYTQPIRIFYESNECHPIKKPSDINCNIKHQPSYAGLNVSLILGYTNMAVWAAGLWFQWKETPWFQRKQAMNEDLSEPADQQVPY